MKSFWKNKKVLITGCSGFTGSWFIVFLQILKCKIFGYSLLNKKKFSFNKLNLKKKITFVEGNILNYKKLYNFIKKSKPDIIYHLAAEPIVYNCHLNPLKSYKINSIGTANLLECIRKISFNKKIQLNIITTDKVYDNINSPKKFSENNQLGGDDIYSISKIASEKLAEIYYFRYFKQKKISVNVLRAGNIIGGGDWSDYRLIPDLMNSIIYNKKMTLRNPKFYRPWQHILDVISAYLKIAKVEFINTESLFNTYNIGPIKNEKISVMQIIKMLEKIINKKIKYQISPFKNLNEKKFLFLNVNKIKNIGITNKINMNNSLKLILKWYLEYSKNNDITVDQTKIYIKKYL